jgi:hypothetical protein
MTTTSITTSSVPSARTLSLPSVLQLDAVVSGANGLAYLLGASLLDDLLGLPTGPLRAAGAFLLAYAAVVGFVGTRRPVPTAPVWAIIVGNAVWAAESLVAVAADLGSPSTVGAVWMVLQAVVVGGFAGLQWSALRRQRTAG